MLKCFCSSFARLKAAVLRTKSASLQMICHIKNITSKQEVPTAEAQAQADVLKKKRLIQVLLGVERSLGRNFTVEWWEGACHMFKECHGLHGMPFFQLTPPPTVSSFLIQLCF